MARHLQAGFAQTDITPPMGLRLAYFDDGKCMEVVDRLYASALVLASGRSKIAIVAADISGIGRQFVESVRSRVEAETGIGRQGILICASHTHSSPVAAYYTSCKMDKDYVETLKERLTVVAVEAARKMSKARLGVGAGALEGVSVNRHFRMKDGSIKMDWENYSYSNSDIVGPAWPKDPAVGVLRVDDERGKPLAVLANFGCHPVTMHYESRTRGAVSADYPGYARMELEKEGLGFLFTNGLFGDVNPVAFSEVRNGKGPEMARRYGTLLAKEVLRVAKAIKTSGEMDLSAISGTALLPVKMPSLFPAEADMGLFVSVEIQLLRLGGLAIVATPFEMFTEIGLDVKRESKAKHTWLVGYANGAVSYLATAKAFLEKGVYEVESSRMHYGIQLPPEAEFIVKDKIFSMLSARGRAFRRKAPSSHARKGRSRK